MSLLRLKYRPAAIEPELDIFQENNSLSLAKRVKPQDDDPYANNKSIRHDAPIFLCTHTQVKRVEVVVSSDEEKLRRKQYPTIHERIEVQKSWAKEQLSEAKVAYERESLKRLLEEKLTAARNSSTEASGEVDSVDGLEMEDEPEESEDIGVQTDAKYAQELIGIKERKLVMTRNTAIYHNELSEYEKTKLAWRVSLGWMGKQDKTLTVVLPWLLLGRRDTSTNLHLLLKLGVTHILNVTHDLPNVFNSHFVYQRISVKDDVETDIGSKFSSAISFLKRVEECKGRVLVHCTAGASRAPSAILSYLVYAKKLSLCDAYTYLRVLRPLVTPNKHFLFQLAMLEVQFGEGCSVYYHKDWQFYEFNTFRAEAVEARANIGLYRTVKKLYTNCRDEDDILT